MICHWTKIDAAHKIDGSRPGWRLDVAGGGIVGRIEETPAGYEHHAQWGSREEHGNTPFLDHAVYFVESVLGRHVSISGRPA